MDNLFALIKPMSAACNLKCNYCFYNDVAANRTTPIYKKMSKETLATIVNSLVAACNNQVSFMFQGGEPTLIGHEFYHYYNELIAQAKATKTQNFVVNSSIQTNGLNFTFELLRELKKGNFLVGVSLDGPEFIHNANRVYKNNQGSFKDVMQGIAQLQKANIDFNILSVVTSSSLAFVEQIINFFIEHKFYYLQFIAAIDPFDKSKNFITDDGFAQFNLKLFDIWFKHYNQGLILSIRFIDDLFSNLITGHSTSCDLSGTCSNQNVIESNGDIFPCDFFVLDKYKLGNVSQGIFNLDHKILNSFTQQAILNVECYSCKLFKLCKGGCKRTRLDNNKSFLCKSFKLLFEKRRHQIDYILQQSFNTTLKHCL